MRIQDALLKYIPRDHDCDRDRDRDTLPIQLCIFVSLYMHLLTERGSRPLIPVPSVGSALGHWVKAGWDKLFIFLCDMLLK